MPEPRDLDKPMVLMPATRKPGERVYPNQENGMAATRKDDLWVTADPGKEELGPPPDWLVLKPVTELSDYLPPQVIYGMLYRGARLAIGGGPKTRKSWLLMQACFCISNKIPFLEIPAHQGPTAYINLELFEGECRQRFVSIANAFGKGDPNKVSVLQARSKGKLLTPALLKHLTLILLENSVIFTALDPVYKLLAGRDENKAGDVAQVLEPIEAMSEEGKTSVAFSQHYAKGNQGSKYAIDRMAGSNVFSRDADVILTLTELREPDCYVVDIKQRSFPEIPSFGVRWTYPLFVRDSSIDITEIRQAGKDKEAQQEDQPTKVMIAALRATDSQGGLSFTEWIKASGVAKSTFNRRLKALQSRKIVYQSKIDGNYMFCPSFCRNDDDLQAA